MKVGDRVWVNYYGKEHIGVVVEVRKRCVRVRFRDKAGGLVNIYRRPSELKIVEEVGG